MDRIPLHVDESCIRKYGVDDSDIVGVDWSLVDDAQLVARTSRQQLQVVFRLGTRAASSSCPLRNTDSRVRSKAFQKSISPAPKIEGCEADLLLGQRRARARHSQNEHRFVGAGGTRSDCCNHVLGIGVNHIVDETIAYPRSYRAMTVLGRICWRPQSFGKRHQTRRCHRNICRWNNADPPHEGY